MHAPKAIMALLVATFLVPMSLAQDPGDVLPAGSIEFNTPSEAVEIAPGLDGTLTFTAELACSGFLDPGTITGGGSQSHTVTVSYPDGFTGTESVEVTFNGQDCVGADPTTAAASSGEQSITISPGVGAVGMEELSVELSAGDNNGTIPFIVDYRPGYQFVVNQQFPVTVEKDENGDWIPVEFTADIVFSANANTMVMMQVTDKAEFGTVSGLFANSPHIFRDLTNEQLENGITKTVTFRYAPTAEGWTEDTIEFITWSHWLDDGSMKTPDQTVSWTFQNADPEDDGEKGAPSLGIAPVALALMAAALVATRRRA